MRGAADRDYYAVLGIAATATEDEVKRTYRRLALRQKPGDLHVPARRDPTELRDQRRAER